jgi:hypothetical protein
MCVRKSKWGARGESEKFNNKICGFSKITLLLCLQTLTNRDNSHANGHNREHGIHEQHKPIHIVKFVVPETGKDEPHLDED